MKVAALAALSVLVALPAEAGQLHRPTSPPAATCDNDGRCSTFKVTVPIPIARKSRSETQSTMATAPRQARGLDANGSQLLVSSYR